MVGYGPEDNHFVVELTYNYGIGSYKLGTDFRVSTVTLLSHTVFMEIQRNNGVLCDKLPTSTLKCRSPWQTIFCPMIRAIPAVHALSLVWR